MRAAIAEMASRRPSSRSAAAGICAISRAIAVAELWSTFCMDRFANRVAQIAVMPPERIGGILERKSEANQDGSLHIAVRQIKQARGIGRRAADDLANDQSRAPPELRVARPHVHHQPVIDAAELYHHCS